LLYALRFLLYQSLPIRLTARPVYILESMFDSAGEILK